MRRFKTHITKKKDYLQPLPTTKKKKKRFCDI